jgi:hypothetical protein
MVRVTGVLAAGFLLVAAAPSPSQAVDALRSGAPGADPTEPLVALAALAAWALAAWLATTTVVVAAGALPGWAGALSAAFARRIAPVAVRRMVELTLGLTAVAGALGPAAASAAPLPAPVTAPMTAPATSQASPGYGDARYAPLDWPVGDPPPAPRPQSRADRSADEPVLVRPGDSLWRLAATELEAATGSVPSAAAVAVAWPHWWAANREAVGADPDLIRPGMKLSPPPAEPSDP